MIHSRREGTTAGAVLHILCLRLKATWRREWEAGRRCDDPLRVGACWTPALLSGGSRQALVAVKENSMVLPAAGSAWAARSHLRPPAHWNSLTAHFREGAHTWLPTGGADDDRKIRGLPWRGSLKYNNSFLLSSFKILSQLFKKSYTFRWRSDKTWHDWRDWKVKETLVLFVTGIKDINQAGHFLISSGRLRNFKGLTLIIDRKNIFMNTK